MRRLVSVLKAEGHAGVESPVRELQVTADETDPFAKGLCMDFRLSDGLGTDDSVLSASNPLDL